jgi:hypothetical protein
MFGRHFEIRKQKTLEEAEEIEPQERTMTVLNLTEDLGVIKDGIKGFDNADSNEWRASKTTKQNVRRV